MAKDFPRCVYGPDGAWKTIKSENERPDGWSNEPGGYQDSDAPKKLTATERRAAARAEKTAAAEALRAGYVKFLTDNDVVVPDDAADDDIANLAAQLEEHLKQNDAGQ